MAMVVGAAGCERSRYIRPRPTIEDGAVSGEAAVALEPAELASAVAMRDEQYASQLVGGFYGVEQGAWRWTKGSFGVQLKPPARSARNGATLRLEFSLPDPVFTRFKEVTISAKVNGQTIPPQTFRASGSQEYVQAVPPAALETDPAAVQFALDHFLAAGTIETRELGVIVTRVSLEPK